MILPCSYSWQHTEWGAAEVLSLTFTDVRWETMTIEVCRPKTGVRTTLPFCHTSNRRCGDTLLKHAPVTRRQESSL